MINYDEIREMLEEEIEEVTKSGKLSPGGLEMLYKVTDTIKNTYKIEMLMECLEEPDDEYSMRRGSSRDGGMSGDDGMSERGRSRASGNSYNDSGDSYARRGQHYVRGHYSREGGMSGRGYSGDDGRQKMLSQLRKMMEEARDEPTREAIHRCMAQLDKE